MPPAISLQDLRAEYGRQRLIAMPIAGAIAWTIAGTLGAVLPVRWASIAMFMCIGMIFWLGVLIGRVTGEPIISREKKVSELDRLFLLTVVMASLVWAIAIPFYLIDPTSLPLSLGILTGLMWVPISWLIQHWIGLFHAIARTLLIVLAWYIFPEHRFVVIPGIIVAIYLISIYVLATRTPVGPVPLAERS